MSIQGQYESSYRLTEQEQQDQLTQLALQHEQDEWAAEKNCHGVRPENISDEKWKELQAGEEAGNCGVREFIRRRTRKMIRAKQRLEAFRQTSAAMDEFKAARQLDFLQMCLDAAKCEYVWAKNVLKKWVGI